MQASFPMSTSLSCRRNSFASPLLIKINKCLLLVPNAISSQLQIQDFYMAKGCEIEFLAMMYHVMSFLRPYLTLPYLICFSLILNIF